MAAVDAAGIIVGWPPPFIHDQAKTGLSRFLRNHTDECVNNLTGVIEEDDQQSGRKED
jgi:hypothetical protein